MTAAVRPNLTAGGWPEKVLCIQENMTKTVLVQEDSEQKKPLTALTTAKTTWTLVEGGGSVFGGWSSDLGSSVLWKADNAGWKDEMLFGGW